MVAISPTSVVWGNIGSGRDGISWPERSSWTLKGFPLPFVPSIPDWSAEHVDVLVSYRGLFQRALQTFSDEAAKAAIPVEAISAEIVLVAGGDDALWPSLDFADRIVRRRQDAGKVTRLVSAPDAGHRILLPGEDTPRSKTHAHGGNDDADARLGREAWRYIRELL